MKRLLSILTAAWFTLCGCHSPPPSTAPETARADEIIASHEREQTASLDSAIESATLLNIPGTIATLNLVKGRLHAFTQAIVKLIVAIEKKVAAMSAEIDRLRSESYRSYRLMAFVGGIIMAAGVAGLFWTWTNRFAPAVIVLGGSLVAVGISLQVIAPWLPLVGAIVTVACAGIIIWTVYGYRRDIVSIVKPADILKSEAANGAVAAVYSAKDSIANKIQSVSAKRLVAAARKAAPARPLKGDK